MISQTGITRGDVINAKDNQNDWFSSDAKEKSQ